MDGRGKAGIRVTPASKAELLRGLLDKVLAGRAWGHASEPVAPQLEVGCC